MNGLITRETKAKDSYCRKEDEIIVNTFNSEIDGKPATVTNVVKALEEAGFTRTKHSLQYRIRKLRTIKSWDDIEYADEKAADANANTDDANAEQAAEVAVDDKKARKGKKAQQ